MVLKLSATSKEKKEKQRNSEEEYVKEKKKKLEQKHRKKSEITSGFCLMGFAYGRLGGNEIGDMNSSSRFGSFCNSFDHGGGYCDISGEVPSEGRKRLMAIRNSLKEVENMVMFLQRLDSRQMMDTNAAFTRLEESRLNLLQNVTDYKGRALDVVTELNACFGYENGVPFNWDSRERFQEQDEPSGIDHKRRFSISNCLRKLLMPWKWQTKVGIALKLVMSAMVAYHIRQFMCSSTSRKMLPYVVSSEAGKSRTTLLTISKSPIDVFFGRG